VETGGCANLVRQPSLPNAAFPHTTTLFVRLMATLVLPPELLTRIFNICINDDPTCCGKIMLVNQTWFAILNSAPHLWQTIHLDRTATRSLKSLHGLATYYVEKSDPLPFIVHITIEEERDLDDILHLVGPCLRYLSRWQTCSITWLNQTSVHTFTTDMDDSVILELFVRDSLDVMAPQSASNETRQSRIADCLPILHQFPRPNDLSISLSVFKLPSALPYSLPFTRLILTEDSSACTSHPRDLLTFLQFCPNLTTLRWAAWSFEFSTMDGLPNMVTLPHLRMLEVGTTLVFRDFMSRLHLPALETLVLANLNVHHPLPTLLSYSEEGDSDDEAADFSQSPCSDHATGMAIRGLIHRSKPPLKTLEMDYVDMRTKDFRWCFERLDGLTHFRIVGSDMSNTVISLLKPIQDLDGNTRLLLPNLTNLELVGALRLSGRAIVSAIHDRIFHIQKASHPRGHMPTAAPFKRVKVSRCPGVLPDDEADLEFFLGARFTTT
jgi:hypothetical protein